MSKVRISADSTCDLSNEILDRYNISVIPLSIVCGEETFKDGVEINSLEIYRQFEQNGVLCSTAAVNEYEYSELFTRMLVDADNVIHFCLSSSMSACYQNACKAAEGFDGKVFVIDSKNLSSGSGHLVYEAALMVEAGEDAADIVDKVNRIVDKVEASFIVDTMEYLKRGGRCSALAAFGATVLKIKPCIEVINGKMTVGSTYRGSFDRCLKHYIKDRLDGRDDIVYDRIFITHSDCTRDKVEYAETLVKKFGNFSEIIETRASCTISCHCGPGTLGILFIRK